MYNRGKRILASVLTTAMVVSNFSTTAFAVETDPIGHSHEVDQTSSEAAECVLGTACYVQYDLNNDGVLSGKDAVELLGVATNPTVYQKDLSKEYDINGDGFYNAQDAIALLKIALWPEKYGYKGNIHAFSGEPVWKWNEDNTVVAEFRCACGQVSKIIKAAVSEPEVKDATCTTTGSVTTQAAVDFLNNHYTNEKTVSVPAVGHTFSGKATCTEAAKCTKCDYVVPAAGHSYTLTDTQTADCTHEATETYTCSVCGDSYTVKTGDPVHTFVYKEERQKGENSCLYEKVWVCSQCYAETTGEEVEHHVYKAAVTQEATCVEGGVKTYTCTNCGDSYTESIPKSTEGHNWVSDETGNGAYTCSLCSETKTVVVAQGNKVSSEKLTGGGEVQINESISVTLDEKTAEQLTGEVTLNVSKLTEEEKNNLGIDHDYKEGSTVYNLSMKDEKGSVFSFNGEVTVKLPYELQPDDDVDCIQVLYVEDNGVIQKIDGRYENGYVYFTTNHFSYYTVTRLTPAQRCELYGHNDKVTVVEPSCENGGYTVAYCSRCGRVEKSNIVNAFGSHDYRVTESKATCTEAGLVTKTCNRCGSTVSETYPATGHTWKTETVDATCTAPGMETKTCTVCGEKQTTQLPQLAHELQDDAVPASCTEQGYILHTCANCDYKSTEYTAAALGHDYKDAWEWNEDNYSAKVTLTCTRDGCGDTVSFDAAVTETVDPAVCGDGGAQIFEARYNYGGTVYKDSLCVDTDPLEHTFGPWVDKGENHAHVCERCGVEEPADHVWDEGEVTKEATCNKEGAKVQTCRECGAKKTVTLPATGIHRFEDGVCVDCGFVVSECPHEHVRYEEKKIRNGDCVHTLRYEVCECGAVLSISGSYPNDYHRAVMKSVSASYKQNDANTLELSRTNVCSGCGLTETFVFEYVKTDEAECKGTVATRYSVSGDSFETIAIAQDPLPVAHPRIRVAEEYDLADYGFCDGQVIKTACVCGELETMLLVGECNFATEWMSDRNANVSSCSECGHKYETTFEKGAHTNCRTETNRIYRFEDENDNPLFTVQVRNFMQEHDGLRYEFEMLGESCTDGYYVTTHCDACGATEKNPRLQTYHGTYLQQTIDLSGYGLCYDTITVSGCPCGAEHVIDGYQYHDMEVQYNEATGEEIHTCRTCGVRICSENQNVIQNGCDENGVRHYSVYIKDGTEVAEWDYDYVNEHHNYLAVNLKPLEDGCQGRVEVTERCTVCGHERVYTTSGSWTNSNDELIHNAFAVERIKLEELGLCGGELVRYQCACGEEDKLVFQERQCRTTYVSSTENGCVEQCTICSALWEVSHNYPESDECVVEGTETLIVTNADNEKVVDETWKDRRMQHEFLCSFDLNGETCADGGTVLGTCSKCGAERSMPITTGWHETYLIRCEETPDNVCPGKISVYSCPCGYNMSVQPYEMGCSWNDFRREWISENEYVETASCSVCHASYEIHGYTNVEVDGCIHTGRQIYSYRDADGKEFFSQETTNISETHEYSYTVQLHGQSCDDGYTVTGICKNCGKTYKDERFGHNSTQIEQEAIHLADHGFCGGILHIYSCACGQYTINSYEYTDNCCNWLYGNETKTPKPDGSGFITTSQGHCSTCQATRTHTREVTYTTADGCYAQVVDTNTYRSATGEEFASQQTYGSYEHDRVDNYTLMGESCKDGVCVQSYCQRCGQSLEDRTIYNHETHRVEKIDLSGLPCGGYYDLWGCACGEEKYVSYNEGCQWVHSGYDEDSGADQYTCEVCGSHKSVSNRNTSTEECVNIWQKHIVLTDPQGEVVLDRVLENSNDNHNFLLVSGAAVNGSCENGFTAQLQCSKCGKSITETDRYHAVFAQEVDLEQKGACAGSYMTIHSCVCGWYSNVDVHFNGCQTVHNRTDLKENDDGTVTWTDITKCRNCGLERAETCTGTRKPGSCEINGSRHTVISLPGEVLNDEVIDHWGTEIHETTHYEYQDGVPCTDGLEYSVVCDRCGQTQYSGKTSWHGTMVLEQEIDLGECGAKCGGKLMVYRCLCGKNQEVYFDSGDYCDFDNQSCDLWVDDAVKDHNRLNPETGSYEWVHSYAYDLVCAVSDPEPCGFRIRVARYWRQVPDDPCMIQRVERWLIGYDPETNTYQKELTITGETVCDHNMTKTEETTENAQGQQMKTTRWVCENCGTTTTEETVDENGLRVKWTVDFVNHLSDGMNQSSTRVVEYLIHGDHTHQVRDRKDYVTAAGKAEWYEYTNTYDFSNCTKQCLERRSDGSTWEHTDESHCFMDQYKVIRPNTCSQFGEVQYRVCMNCNKKSTGMMSPTGHSWSYDPSKEVYVCSFCGLESAVGATGSIVIEDLTESYGKGTDFVIGYWNKNDVPVFYYVSAILNDVSEEKDEEQVLEPIAFTELTRETDGITAITFNKAEALAQAQSKVNALGYTGSYDIRFAFVPQHGDTTLDYAITLTGVAGDAA